MNDGAKARSEVIVKRREAERAEFEIQLQAQRDKAQQLRALRLAKEEARWAEDRPKVIEDIKAGLLTLREKIADMRTKHLEKN
jgi:hypothetical protein